MARPTRTPPSKWIEEGLRALAAGGPDAVRVEALARALGVTKGGFYNHFDDRPTLLDEMLETWERLVIDQVIERVESGGGDARAKLRRLFALGSSSARDLVKI
jgi:AcrR family transcriptional regulator